MTTTQTLAQAFAAFASRDPMSALAVVALLVGMAGMLVSSSLEMVSASRDAGKDHGFMLGVARILSWPFRAIAGDR